MSQTTQPTTTPEPTPAAPATRKPLEPWIEITETPDGFRWCLWSGNGDPLACSVIAYPDKKHVVQAVRAIEKNLKGAKAIYQSHPIE